MGNWSIPCKEIFLHTRNVNDISLALACQWKSWSGIHCVLKKIVALHRLWNVQWVDESYERPYIFSLITFRKINDRYWFYWTELFAMVPGTCSYIPTQDEGRYTNFFTVSPDHFPQNQCDFLLSKRLEVDLPLLRKILNQYYSSSSPSLSLSFR